MNPRALPLLFLLGCSSPKEPPQKTAIIHDTIKMESPQTDSLANRYEQLLEIKDKTIISQHQQNKTLKQENENLKAQMVTIRNADVYTFIREYRPERHRDSLSAR